MANDITNVIRYSSRTFSEIRADLIALINEMYPEVLSDFSDSSVGSMLIDLNAGVANNLAINTDRVFQETQLEYAQQKTSILNIAKNLGFNIPPRRPSVTVVDLSVIVPVLGDRPDPTYYPVLDAGAQVVGAGKIFEIQDIVNWNSPVNSMGVPNRSILPNLDSNGNIISYTVTKREIAINGATNIYKQTISASDIVPFFSVTLPDPDVLEIISVILMESNATPQDEDFNNPNYRYYEVDYLAQQRIFVEDINFASESGLKKGYWMDVTKKFIKEYTPNGYCKLIFGSGDNETNVFRSGMLKMGITNQYFLYNFLNNTALGEKLKPNHTLYIKYRTGGGANANVGANVLNSFGVYNIKINGSREDYNQQVKRSLRVTNPIPAVGGNDGLSVEQIRHLIKYNFSSQYRDVTLNDYLVQVYKMPGKFGSPFRANAFKENNKVVISILTLDEYGKLSNVSSSLLKENLAEYLSNYRMINDYIEIRDGKIYNLAFDIDVLVDNVNDTQVANNIISLVKEYLDINKYQMGQNIFLSRLQKQILEANGVINLIKIKVYNKVGGLYSNNIISQKIKDTITGEIEIINNTIYSTKDSMFEIKYPEKDIRVFLRKNIE